MPDDNMRSMIERYKRELISFNKRNPQRTEFSPPASPPASAASAASAASSAPSASSGRFDKGTAAVFPEAAPETSEDEAEDEIDRSMSAEATETAVDVKEDIEEISEAVAVNVPDDVPAEAVDADAVETTDDVLSVAVSAPFGEEADVEENDLGDAVPAAAELTEAESGGGETPLAETDDVDSISPHMDQSDFSGNSFKYPPYSDGGGKEYMSEQDFLKDNSKTGILKVQVYEADGLVPVSNAKVVVSKDFGGRSNVFYTEFTDVSGIVYGLTLPSPDKALSAYPTAFMPYATYDITVERPGFVKAIYKNCAVFDGIETIQLCELIPSGG